MAVMLVALYIAGPHNLGLRKPMECNYKAVFSGGTIYHGVPSNYNFLASERDPSVWPIVTSKYCVHVLNCYQCRVVDKTILCNNTG